MRVKQWKYFWSWALLLAFLLAFGATCVLYFKPKIYSGTLLAQPLELYPGEDLSFPEPPDNLTVRRIEGTALVEIRGLDQDQKEAADRTNDFYRDWLRQRRNLIRSELSSRQKEFKRGSVDWRKLELERRGIPPAGISHLSATISSKPTYPNVDTYLGIALPLSAALGMSLAFLLTRRRGERPGDGDTIGLAEIGSRFKKFAPVLCGLFVAISMVIFLQQPRAYRSTTTLEFLPHNPETFATQLEILKSRAPLIGAVNKEKLYKLMEVSTVETAVDELLVDLEIAGYRDKSTAEIQFVGHDRDIVELLPSAIARAFIAKRVQVASLGVKRRREELESAASLYADMGLFVAEAEAEIAKLPEPGSVEETATITAVDPPEKLAKDWIGWLRDSAMVEIVRGCVWGLLLTFLSLLYLTRFSKKQKVPAQEFTPWEPEKVRGIGPEPSTDPY